MRILERLYREPRAAGQAGGKATEPPAGEEPIGEQPTGEPPDLTPQPRRT